jgi:hypothetical protein
MRPFTARYRIFFLVATFLLIGGKNALAREARPWLCRVKPVFTSKSAMVYTAQRTSDRWRLTFMSFDPNGGHDGFTVVDSRDLGAASTNATGRLESGTYFVVGQYANRSGEWICPGSIQDHDRPEPGEVTRICFGARTPSCGLEVTVKPAVAASR